MTLVAQELPKVGLVMETVKVIRWLKRVGDSVVVGENLLEVETEKSVVEIEAGASGRLQQILVPVDEEASIGDTLAWIESGEAEGDTPLPRPLATAEGPRAAPAAATAAGVPGAASEANGASGASETTAASEARAARAASGASGAIEVREAIAASEARAARAASGASGAGGAIEVREAIAASEATAARIGERIRSSPAARKLAAEHGLDPAAIAGTGPAGRVQLEDVQRAIDAPRAPVAGGLTLSPMRRAVARAMSLSATVPQFMVSRSVDWTLLKTLRREFAAKLPTDSPPLSVNDFLLQAVARALIELPGLNATFLGDAESGNARLLAANGAHIGLAVAVEHGLLVPVIHDVQKLSLAEIARHRVDCVARALQGRLKRDETDGATFSISNLGADGPDRFSALINPPQSAILAVGRQRDCVVPREGAIVVRPLSELTLTVDHRVADGRLAAQFLAQLCAHLEGPDWYVS
jgi:pyruvate dehydrogenase E2 component (dihydrolipoamide acetyltransferase)